MRTSSVPCHVVDQRQQRERLEVKLHAPCLDLRQVENVVDQSEQKSARTEYPIERLEFIVPLQIPRVFAQHLCDADDGVEWR
jgi:hypothetical protein